MKESKDHLYFIAPPKHNNCRCEVCYPFVHRWAYKKIFELYQVVAETNGELREEIKRLEAQLNDKPKA